MTHITLLIVIAILLIPHSCNANETPKLIADICSHTSNFNYCKTVFIEHMYTPYTDIKGLTQIAITQTLLSATDTLRFIARAINSEKIGEIKDQYKSCQVEYENLVNFFVDADFAFGKRDYKGMLFYVEKCERFVSDCEHVMRNQAPQLDTQNSQNRVLVQMTVYSGQLISGQLISK